jgi:hypothetical protein
VLTLYRRLARELEQEVRQLPPAPLAVRFECAMRAKLALVLPYRDAFGALFASAMNPQTDIAVLGENTADIRHTVGNAFHVVVAGATDAPREQQTRQLATVLYAAHLGLLLFWLQDRSLDTRSTETLLAFTRDTLGLVRRLLRLPPFAKALARLANILDPIFGDTGSPDWHVPQTRRSSKNTVTG